MDAPAGDDGRFVLLKGRAGLGNRLLAAASGLLYAQLTHRRLVVDWRDGVYAPDGSNAFPELFDCGECASLEELPETGSVAPEMWSGRTSQTALEVEARFAKRPTTLSTKRYPMRANADFLRDSTVDLARLDYDERVLVMWLFTSRVERICALHGTQRAELAGRQPADILREKLRRFVVKPPIRERVDRLRAELFTGPVVGVHVRYTDRKSHLRAILRQLDGRLAREPGALVFLATDNAAIRDRLERRYQNVVTLPHWYPRKAKRLHRNPDCPDVRQAAVDAVVDLYLLAACDSLICDTTSSFARVAALLRAPGAEPVVDVKDARRKTAARRLRRRIARRFSAVLSK
jgi:hypothetical protein